MICIFIFRDGYVLFRDGCVLFRDGKLNYPKAAKSAYFKYKYPSSSL